MLAHHVEVSPDGNGTFLVTWPDLPEVTSFGKTEAAALNMGNEAISEALASHPVGLR